MSYRHRSTFWVLAVFVLMAVAIWWQGGMSSRDVFRLVGLCFACELIDSGLGMGYGTILTPTLLLMGYSPADIVPTVLLSELLSGFSAAFFHHGVRNVELGRGGRDLKPALILAGGSLAGVSVGVLVSISLPRVALSMVIGCIIFMSGLFVILLSRSVIAYRRWRMVLLSVVASFNKAVSGGGYGPLVTSGQILSGIQTRASVGITSFAEAFTCLLAVTLFLLQGGHIDLAVFIPMAGGALSSVPFAVFAIKLSNEDHLKIVIGVLTMTMGGLTIFKALG